VADETGPAGGGGMGVEERIRLVIDEESAKRAEAEAAAHGERIAEGIAEGGQGAGDGIAQGITDGLRKTEAAAGKTARNVKGQFVKTGQDIAAELPPPVMGAWARIASAGRTAATTVSGAFRTVTRSIGGWFNDTAKGMLTAFAAQRVLGGAFSFTKELFTLSTDLGRNGIEV
jgi:hypothetical protein